ncbi:VOC family protein [Flammeovirga pectinis]|uniref:VOC family protein n=1 Tax=Flammeovirga pectinis TaxID=2494373 RepID=A0A3Q9FR25_9BACT|nr:VOC family protein [Flammeovirga pectinis]AZQ65125.1 VOC family protein [Flammeovirga pectinis]
MEIKKLVLFSSDITKQKAFYQDVLGFKLAEIKSDYFNFNIGNSLLEFRVGSTYSPYHFAINIPAYKEKEAVHFLNDRLNVLSYNKQLIQDFENWNAKAVYFYDADNNIVEFISRRNLKNSTTKTFDLTQCLSISEIGIATTQLERTFEFFNKMNLSIYDGSFEKFLAVGDEEGLFICVHPDKKKWFPTDDKIHKSNFIACISIENCNYKVIFNQSDLSVLIE